MIRITNSFLTVALDHPVWCQKPEKVLGTEYTFCWYNWPPWKEPMKTSPDLFPQSLKKYLHSCQWLHSLTYILLPQVTRVKRAGCSARKILMHQRWLLINDKVFDVRVKPLKHSNTSNAKTSFYKNVKQSDIGWKYISAKWKIKSLKRNLSYPPL